MGIISFDIQRELNSLTGYKGLPFPGAYTKQLMPAANFKPSYHVKPAEAPATSSTKGSVIRKIDAMGRWYFMPVYFITDTYGIEATNAVVSISCEKTIVKTPMAGTNGSVKELISINDYNFKIAGAIIGPDWPESGITTLHELFLLNDTVSLQCALTEIFLKENDKVIITKIDYPESRGIENVQFFTMECVSDTPFELTIE